MTGIEGDRGIDVIHDVPHQYGLGVGHDVLPFSSVCFDRWLPLADLRTSPATSPTRTRSLARTWRPSAVARYERSTRPSTVCLADSNRPACCIRCSSGYNVPGEIAYPCRASSADILAPYTGSCAA